MNKPEIINLYTESNPNPNSLKFVANYMLMPEGESRDFRTVDLTEQAPLAKSLFDFPFVKGVFYMSNFITVTKDESVEWFEVKDDVQAAIKKYLMSGDPILLEDKSSHQIEGSDDLEAKIRGILDEYIKPAVEMDGGAITFHSFDEGKLKVLLQGSCSGCPSSTVTLKAGIENLMRRMVPEVEEVLAEEI